MTQANRVHSTKPTNTSLTRRKILGTIAAAATAVAAKPAGSAGIGPTAPDDPIYAAIEKHRAACIVWDAAVDVRASLPEGPEPMTDEQWEERDRLDDAEEDAREPLAAAGVDLVTTAPTTLAGIVAAVSYIRAQMRDYGTYMPYTSEFESGFEYTEGCAGDSLDIMSWIDAFLDTLADATAALDKEVQS
jgi:hypothetical protein